MRVIQLVVFEFQKMWCGSRRSASLPQAKAAIVQLCGVFIFKEFHVCMLYALCLAKCTASWEDVQRWAFILALSSFPNFGEGI